MKAILVIDVPDEMGDDVKALHITLYNGMYTQDISINAEVRPLPEKFTNLTSRDVFQSHKMGWNACINTILGETYEENDNR